jgi:hypothetical protein
MLSSIWRPGPGNRRAASPRVPRRSNRGWHRQLRTALPFRGRRLRSIVGLQGQSVVLYSQFDIIIHDRNRAFRNDPARTRESTPGRLPWYSPDSSIPLPIRRPFAPVRLLRGSARIHMIWLSLSTENRANSRDESIFRPVFGRLQGSGSSRKTGPMPSGEPVTTAGFGAQPPPILGIR